MFFVSMILSCFLKSHDSKTDLREVAIEINSSGIIDCEQPELRSVEPMRLANLGEDWVNQPVEGYSPPLDFMVGGEGIAVGDFTNDGLLDIFVPTLSVDLFFVQQEDGKFVESGVDFFSEQPSSTTLGASAADYDGDGDLDLFVLNVESGHQLFENQEGERFVDVSAEFNILNTRYDTFGATWGDADLDGDLDLLVLNTGYGPLGPPPWNDSNAFEEAGPNILYINEDSQTFRKDSLPNHDPEPYSCCAAFIDVDLDFIQDLYIVNDFGMYVQPNQLFIGNDDGFVPQYNTGVEIGMYGMGLAVGDVNQDDYPDFAVSDWGRNWLLVSDGYGQWYDNTFNSQFVAGKDTQQVAWGIELQDVDNDGDLDAWVGYGFLSMPDEEQESFDALGLYNTRNQPDALFLQENGVFTDRASEWGLDRTTISRGGVWADLNNDGFLDFVSAAIDGPVQAYIANCDDSNWIRIHLNHKGSTNRDGVGARIKITAGNSQQSRWVLAGTSLSSSGPLEAHFGLGGAQNIDHIEIYWPDQTVSRAHDIESNQILEITRTE